MSDRHEAHVARSRELLLAAIGTPPDLTLVQPHGNLGDQLIQAGTRRLLAAVPCRELREVSVRDAAGRRGHTALLGGSGGWCAPFHGLTEVLRVLEQRFERVIVMPSSFDTGVPEVRAALARSRATVFAREPVSFANVEGLCRAGLAHDCAFYFDYSPYRMVGAGELVAFRTDEESARARVPAGNRDLSVDCASLDEWLWTIARHARVRTDRAHVTIAAALLGKEVGYAPSSYHKIPAIVEWSLAGFRVARLGDEDAAAAGGAATEAERLRVLGRRLAALVPEGSTCVLVDEPNPGAVPLPDRRLLPFLERDGTYWGRPADDAQAIAELERMRAAGAAALAFARPAHWWLEHYTAFARHLRERHACTADDDGLVCFDLRSVKSA